jgi:hypothetical protein
MEKRITELEEKLAALEAKVAGIDKSRRNNEQVEERDDQDTSNFAVRLQWQYASFLNNLYMLTKVESDNLNRFPKDQLDITVVAKPKPKDPNEPLTNPDNIPGWNMGSPDAEREMQREHDEPEGRACGGA